MTLSVFVGKIENVGFNKGQLVQKGSHDSLVAVTDGKYAELWNAQAQYYKT